MSLIYYTFRLDINFDDNKLTQLQDYIKSNFPKYALFNEIGDETKKPHIQGKIGSTSCLQTLRNKFKKTFPTLFVGTLYSITYIKDKDKYDSYICKQDNIWINNIFSQDDINNFNKNYEYKEKVKATTFTQKVFKDFVIEYEHDYNILKQLSYYNYKLSEQEKEMLINSKKQLLEYILKRLGSLTQVFDSHILQKMYNGILNSILQDDKQSQKRQMEYWANVIQL